MTIGDYATHFAGQPIINWNVDEEELDTGQQELDPNTTVYRISVNSWESEISWSEAFAAFLNAPGAAKTTGLVIGTWDFEPDIQQGGNEAARIVEALATARDRLPNLTAIFFGDILSLDSEISWIQQTDVSPLFEAYPALQEFRVRGGNGLRFGRLHHESLKTLIVETGGLDRGVVQDILASHLPNLEHLELWLGDENYGANTTIDDFASLFNDQIFPKLRYLGLRDSEYANQLASAITQSPLLARLEVLDLSLGLLDDEGAQALLDCPATRQLRKLDLHFHYCSKETMARLKTLPIEVDVSERQEPHHYGGEEYRYIAVSE